jgi:hypothetical protein
LPVEKQRALIEYEWNVISSPAMLPVLRQLYQHPPDLHEIPSPFPGAALMRIYELAPAEGRQLILDELSRPDSRVGISVLGLLPDKELPQLEDTLVSNAMNRMDATSIALVSRYVSAASLPRLRVVFERLIGRMACAQQASLLSYFLRADQNYGLEMTRKALGARKVTRCYPDVLIQVAGDTITPEFEALAAQYLDDPHPEVVMSAVKVLCEHGSVANKSKIKVAIKRLLQRWQEEKVDPDAPLPGGVPFAGYLAESLLRVYAKATPWVTPREEFQELADLCLTAQCRQQLKPRDLTADTNIFFFYFEGSHAERRFTLGEYETLSWLGLKQKVLQFPKGAKFTWHLHNAPKELDEKLFDELKSYLAENGFQLGRFEPPDPEK